MASVSDVIVVGAGIVGCAIADELARRGVSVHLLDDRAPGMGATQASAGVLAPYIEAVDQPALLELTARSLELFDPFVARVITDSGVSVPYCRSGTIQPVLSVDGFRYLQTVATAIQARGVHARLLDARDIRSVEPHLTGDVVGGLQVPSHGFVAARQLTLALLASAAKNGATYRESGRVREVVREEDDRLVVVTDQHRHRADAVVVAAGSWSGQVHVAGAAALPVRPVRGQLLYLGWSGAAISCVTWGERCYLVPWTDGTLLVGATMEEAGFDERNTAAGVRDLIEAACELVPSAWTAAVTSIKTGLRPATPDGLPVIGPSAIVPRLFYATGHFRNGILLAPLTAHLLADAILDGRMDPVLSVTAPSRFGAV